MKQNKVIRLIKNRKAGIPDNRKLGMIIQGGGLRGSFAGGVMIGLQELGYADVFDVIYGVSAGNCCGAYLLAHQTRLGTPIFYEDLNGFKFIQPWRLLKKMNLDYMVDNLMVHKRHLDVDKIKKSKTDLKIVVTEAKNGKFTYFSKNEDDFDLLTAIKASCAYPGFYYPQVKVNGKKYLDGNAVKSFPIREAIHDGCTDILIVATVPESYREKPHKKAFFLLERLLTLPLSKRTTQELFDRIKHYNREIARVFNYEKTYPEVNVDIIAPEYMVKNVERSAQILEKFAKHGEEEAKRAFL